MIKKTVLICGVILTYCVLGKVVNSRYYIGFVNEINPIVNNVREELKEEIEEKEKRVFSFANELLPEDDIQVDKKMKRALKANSFRTMQTHKLHQRAEKFFPIIEPILEKYGIPEDFKYMPLVESHMKHGAVSVKGATGFWQFMPQTARHYGLKVNENIDERNNVRKSTVAAAKYIRDLYKVFNNWTLVAAAYNVGEGGLKRQLNKQKKDNYYDLKLNKETGRYVYSLISMKEVIENPLDYGYKVKNPKQLIAYKD